MQVGSFPAELPGKHHQKNDYQLFTGTEPIKKILKHRNEAELEGWRKTTLDG